jgi:hypothetical protein
MGLGVAPHGTSEQEIVPEIGLHVIEIDLSRQGMGSRRYAVVRSTAIPLASPEVRI